MSANGSPLRVGIGGPVGSGKTALTLALCKALRDKYDIAAVIASQACLIAQTDG